MWRKGGREGRREGRRERHEGLGREEGREILEAETKREREGMGKGGSEEGRIREGVRE